MRSYGKIAVATLVASISACSSVPHSHVQNTADDEFNPSAETVAAQASESPAANAADVDTSDNSQMATREASAMPKLSTQKARHQAAWSGHSQSPSIEKAPFQAGNFWLNAYYFVRGDHESYQGLSTLLYGRPDRASFLKQWNKNEALVAGTIVYYNSPARPDDSQAMKIFAEDFGLNPDHIVVKQGESLSSIAAEHFGNAKSWVEIAACNPQLPNPDSLEVGQSLAMQPAQIDTTKPLNDIVSKAREQVAEQVQNETAAQSPPVASPPAPSVTQQDAVPAPSIPKPSLDKIIQTPISNASLEQAKRASRTGIKNARKALSEIPDTALIGAGALLLLLLVGIMLKRRMKKPFFASLANVFRSKSRI